MNNFWRRLGLPLINCDIELDLSRLRNCVISEISRTDAATATAIQAARQASETHGAAFQINSAKLYASSNYFVYKR